ncbi:hypothetical protein ACFFF5_12815 [Lederbergia wuyishanensis]|uniref:Uncharacterized protein n=1 Tax=Lederbergia wuyishanensis TaxID=1347903 RepID=A0ABU0D890_9BACI|nr:hypothetical protein [Lederbergia wuyishanensis]MCJ8009291.1 hypothetical protein [Lederbergia wuyishanensis]MDQ0344575.1 hypothetical protein [Lederbergia wuyishanensis]
MSNKMKLEMNKIEIPTDLHERSKRGVFLAKSEMPRNKRRMYLKSIAIAASIAVGIAGYTLFNQNSSNRNEIVVTNDGSLEIPAIQLPKKNTESMSMIGLVVYNGKVYTQTATEIDSEHAKALVDEKLGTSKPTIDEWSKQDEYSVEFASTIGNSTIYSVKGYNKDFRIMAYDEVNGEVFTELYECLNGITIHNGNDIFGQLKIADRVVKADYRTYSDWNYSRERYKPIEDMETLSAFVNELNNTTPESREKVEELLGDFRNDKQYRQLILHLEDGTKVSLVLIKGGYISYGITDYYFKMDNTAFSQIWDQIT